MENIRRVIKKEVELEIEDNEIEVEEEVIEDEINDGPTLNTLDENDPIEFASKNLLETCLATGAIPLNTEKLALQVVITTDTGEVLKNGDKKLENATKEIIEISLCANDKSVAIQGLIQSWLSSLKDYVDLEHSLGEEITEEENESLTEHENAYNSAFNELKDSLKYLLDVARKEQNVKSVNDIELNDNFPGIKDFRSGITQIKALKDTWAFDEIFKLPRRYVSFAFYEN